MAKRSERVERTPTLTAEYVSVIDMLPPEAQRVVNEHLPRLEALADDAVEQFGHRLAKALDARVRDLADVEKSASHAELVEMCKQCPAADDTLEAEKRIRDAAGELLRNLAEAQAGAGYGPQEHAVATRMAPLRDAVQQLRRDIAAGEPWPGMGAFGTAFENWQSGFEEDEMAPDAGETDALAQASQALVSLIYELGEPDRDWSPPAGHEDIPRIEDVAHKATAIHERARDAASRRPASEDQSSPEFVARRLDELNWLLEEASGADVADASDEMRRGVRVAKQAAAHLDRQIRTQSFGVIDAWLRALRTGAGDATIEEARLACSKTHAYYDAPGALARTLTEFAEENAVLGRELEALAAQHERERRNRALEAGVSRLEHLVEQTAQRMATRAATAHANALEGHFATVRSEVDALTKATEAMKEKVAAAAAVVSAGRRFLRDREEASHAICRAVTDITKAAGLTSGTGG